MSALLAYHDFMETGAPDLFRTYENRLYNRTNIDAVDSTGLVNTSKGRHIVVSVVYDMIGVSYLLVKLNHTPISRPGTPRPYEACL